MKIKDTLHLGNTNFPMRGSLPTTEPERQSIWEEKGLYNKRLEKNKQKPHFNLHDGPPYANGNIHIGHALNKISKDFIVRHKNMTGFYAPYIPGWDTHGLPIEQQLTKAGNDRKKMSINEWRMLARNYALEQVNIQKNDFRRLGVLADWDDPYLTLNADYEAKQIEVFAAMVKNELIYRGSKPVYWSWSSESALAEAEIEYHDITTDSAYYANEVKDGKGILDEGTKLVVWTTTPWTVPGSRGISVGPDFEYVLIREKDSKFVVAKELLDTLKEKFEWEDAEVIKTFSGLELDRIVVSHPFLSGVELLVMNGEHVTLDSGTGLVHTAPGFGEDDYEIGIKYGLEVAAPVDDQGKLTKEAGADFEGIFYQDADKVTLEKLSSANLLLKVENIKHSYPFDWRTKQPIIWRAIPQWFASVDKIRDDILKSIETVSFTPEWGKKRLHNMIRDRGDWVISRQRAWGVPLPIFYAEDDTPILDVDVILHVADLFKQHGSDYWFEHEANELLPDNYKNVHSPNNIFKKETDIMDVWFDSGSSWNAVANNRDEMDYPADLYLEGSDQFRGWFNSSLITSVAANNTAPYKNVLHQGFVLDGKGEKMSKSLGNTILPNDVANKMGAEIIRLWVLSVNADQDIKVSDEILKQVADSYRKIRNTLRFLLANTNDFNPKKDAIDEDELFSIDAYMNERFKEFEIKWEKTFDTYKFNELFKQLINFVNVDLSSFYLDVAKDIVYIESRDSKERRSMQTVMYKMLVELTKLITPILPHTAEEIWENLQFEKEDFAYLTEIQVPKEFDEKLISDWQVFFNLRDEINKKIEVARTDNLIGKNAEAKVTMSINQEISSLFNKLKLDLRKLLMVSQLVINKSENSDIVDEVLVEHAEGEVDQRDRLYHLDVGIDEQFPTLSQKNIDIILTDFPNIRTEGIEE